MNTSTYPCRSLQWRMREMGHEYVDISEVDVEGMEGGQTKHWGPERRIDQILLEFQFWFQKSTLAPILARTFDSNRNIGIFHS
jgi:hypothetical protein